MSASRVQNRRVKLLFCSVSFFLQAVFDCLGHKNVLVNSRLEQGPVLLKDGDLIEAR